MKEAAKRTDPVIEQVLETRTVGKAQSLMRSRSGTVLLAVISFIEAALPVPILTDPFLAAAIMVDRTKTARLIFVTIIASVLGGLFAYATAYFFRDVLLSWLSPDVNTMLEDFIANEGDSIFLLTLIGAVTPVPYTFAGWAVGSLEGNLMIFIFGSLLGRGFRYVLVGWCVYVFGPTALKYAKRSILLTSIALFIAAGLYIWLKL